MLRCWCSLLQSREPSAGASATIRIPVAAASGRKMFVGANAVAEQNDAAPNDNSGSLQLKILPGKLKRFTFGVVPGRTSAGVLVVYVKLSAAARVTAQFYVQGAPQPIVWHRSLPAGTTGARIALLPQLKKGAHYSIVLRAVSGKHKASAKVKLVA